MASTSKKASSSTYVLSSNVSRDFYYDVFLSFRGTDTRRTFTGHLYASFVQAGIRTFLDEEEVSLGYGISSELQSAIQNSRILIVVFSENYASSSWCLDELSEIMDCNKRFGQLVIPVFYNVEPSDVRHQNGNVAAALRKHERRQMYEAVKWRAALTDIANLSGYTLDDANGHEARLIQMIVEKVLLEVKPGYLNVADHLVGIDSYVQHIKSFHPLEKDDVCMIGLYGMGGVGKTTVAKVVYNSIFNLFDGKCFIENVREVSKTKGLVFLLENILNKILKTNIKISTVDEGITLVKTKFRLKRVLIVLDDLDDYLSQVQSLVGHRNWYGPGSKIIITTRDEHLLDQIPVDAKYTIEELGYNDSLELLRWHAFRDTVPLPAYMELSNDFVRYAGGIPLALEVLGTYLYGRPMVEWRSALEMLAKIPHDQIQEKLKISFDALNENEKNIFLDIACFFIGMSKNDTVQILDACDLSPQIGISVLKEKCLLTFGDTDQLLMHDLIRDMGREIVRKESPTDPGKRSRLWLHDDAYSVLNKSKGTEAIGGVILDLYTLRHTSMRSRTFEKMNKLRLLKINNLDLKGTFQHLFEELRWLCWHYCPLNYLPYNFQPEKLVILDMTSSDIKKISNNSLTLPKLKVLNLSESKWLLETPAFTGMPMLERLLLEGCTSLSKVHESIGVLSKLMYLNLRECSSLKYLPNTTSRLSLLEQLDLYGCSNLEKLPDELGYMTTLKGLVLDGTAVQCLPDTIEYLYNLTTLSTKGCKRKINVEESLLQFLPFWDSSPISFVPLNISRLRSLRKLDLSECDMCNEEIPLGIGCLVSLEELNLSGNKYETLPLGIGELRNLKELYLSRCTSLRYVFSLPRYLRILHARDCTSLEDVQHLSEMHHLEKLILTNCSKLNLYGLTEVLTSLEVFDMAGCCHLAKEASVIAYSYNPSSFAKSLYERNIKFDMFLPVFQNVADWYRCQCGASEICFHVSKDQEIDALKLIVVVGYTNEGSTGFETPLLVVIKNCTSNTTWTRNGFLQEADGENLWLSYSTEEYPVRGGDKIQVHVIISDVNVKVKGLGFNLPNATALSQSISSR